MIGVGDGLSVGVGAGMVTGGVGDGTATGVGVVAGATGVGAGASANWYTWMASNPPQVSLESPLHSMLQFEASPSSSGASPLEEQKHCG